jgi:hypothetical protein
LARCRHCGILFPTHPRNRGRRDIGCPFGCRKAHAGKRSTERSTAFYRTKNGKRKKKALNNKRSKHWRDPNCGPEPEEQRVSPEPEEQRVSPEPEASPFDPEMVAYLQMVTSLIEGRAVSRTEIVQILNRRMRQRSIGHVRRIDYVLRYLTEHPP